MKAMIKHYWILKGTQRQKRYLCNQACGITKEKLANDVENVTCKNCLRILQKG